MGPDGLVAALCGLSFVPRPTLRVAGQPGDQHLTTGPLALRGSPSDKDQVCPECRGGVR